MDPPNQPHGLRDVGLFALVPHGEKNHHGQLPHIYQPRAAEVRIETEAARQSERWNGLCDHDFQPCWSPLEKHTGLPRHKPGSLQVPGAQAA